MATLLPEGKQSYTDSTGAPLVGGKLYTYDAGTSNPRVTYQDAAGTIPNTNPIILDARGEATIFWQGSYKVVLKDASDVTIWTVDSIQSTDAAINALSSALSSSAGASMVGFSHAVSYAQGTTGLALQAVINVKNAPYNAKGDGVTDDTAAMQAAHATGQIVYYPAGTYVFSSITMSSGGIVGASMSVTSNRPGATILKGVGTSSADLITFTGNSTTSNHPVFRDFTLLGDAAKTVGVGLRFNPTDSVTDQINGATVSRVHFRLLPICVQFDHCADFSVTDCRFFFYRTWGIALSNDTRGDVGDSTIYGNHFFNGAGGSYGALGYSIYQKNSGGLKVQCNKFNGGQGAYLLDLTESTSILVFSGNSVENMSGAGLNFNNNTNTVVTPIRFSHAIINGNQFGQNNVDISFNAIANYLGSSYWDGIVITNNSSYFLNGVQNAISINTARDFIIEGNVFRANYSGYRAILIDSTCSNGKIGRNVFSAFLNSSILNESTTTRIDGDVQTGSVTGVAITALYGAAPFYANTGTVTFAKAFENVPTVLSQTTTSGAILGTTIYNVSATGFAYQIIASNNTTTGAFTWRAEGTISST